MREENIAPINIQKVIWNSSLIHILNSALELGIFDVIQRSAYDLKEIAEKIKASQKGTRVLLDALVVKISPLSFFPAFLYLTATTAVIGCLSFIVSLTSASILPICGRLF